MAVTFLSLYAQAREIAPTTEGKKDAQFPLLEGVMEGDMPLSQAFIGVRPILRNACESKGHERYTVSLGQEVWRSKHQAVICGSKLLANDNRLVL